MANAKTVIDIARKEVGYHEGRSGGHWNNDQKYSDQLPGFKWSDFQAWCATFVCWVFWKAGLLGLIKTPSASVDALSVGFKKAGRWNPYPAIGAVVFYGTPADLNHTGIVYDYDADSIYTIEGNTNDSGSREGDGVYLKKRRRRDSYVVGYGYPEYEGGIKSADPNWKNPPAPKGWTRGPKIDGAIKLLVAAKPNPENADEVAKALAALRAIKPWSK